MNHLSEIMTGLYLVSELLALIPSIKANSTFELVYNLIKDAKYWIKK